MKILIYGAGVLGSYMANEFAKSGNDVSMLARGKRYEDLNKNGLIIRHWLQRKTTSTKVKLVEQFGKNDFYDVIFVVMQSTQIDSVLDNISRNEKCKQYILIGNNLTAKTHYDRIQKDSTIKPMVLFGFCGVGGRRENGRVISIHTKHPTLVIGDITKTYSYKAMISSITQNTNFKVTFSEEMDSWLKCHLACILPIAYACYLTEGNLKKIAHNKVVLNDMIDAMKEGYEMLESIGYTVPKEDKEFVTKQRKKCYWFLKICTMTPLGKLIASDHCMAAKDEMYYLDETFMKLKLKTSVNTPKWDKLQQHIINYRNNEMKL